MSTTEIRNRLMKAVELQKAMNDGVVCVFDALSIGDLSEHHEAADIVADGMLELSRCAIALAQAYSSVAADVPKAVAARA